MHGALPGRGDGDFRSQVRSVGCPVKNLSQGYGGSREELCIPQDFHLPLPHLVYSPLDLDIGRTSTSLVLSSSPRGY